eukprot:4018051-Pyramimonas_sp.AAC.1
MTKSVNMTKSASGLVSEHTGARCRWAGCSVRKSARQRAHQWVTGGVHRAAAPGLHTPVMPAFLEAWPVDVRLAAPGALLHTPLLTPLVRFQRRALRSAFGGNLRGAHVLLSLELPHLPWRASPLATAGALAFARRFTMAAFLAPLSTLDIAELLACEMLALVLASPCAILRNGTRCTCAECRKGNSQSS